MHAQWKCFAYLYGEGFRESCFEIRQKVFHCAPDAVVLLDDFVLPVHASQDHEAEGRKPCS